MSDLLLTGVTWHEADGTERRGDIALREGLVTEVGSVDDTEGLHRLDADGLTALPGFVDLHTHLREPGREDAETIALRLPRRRGRGLHRGPRHGQHDAGHRHRRGRRARPRPRAGRRARRRRAGRRGDQGPRGRASSPSSGS